LPPVSPLSTKALRILPNIAPHSGAEIAESGGAAARMNSDFCENQSE